MGQATADVVVVGGGLAGLAAAAYLGRAGSSVVVLEKAAGVGGRATTRIEDGFHINQGPHALYRRGAAAAVLRELGIPFTGGVPPASGYAILRGVPHALPIGLGSLLTTRLFGVRAKWETARILAGIPRLDAAALQHVPVRSWLEGALADADARALVEAIVRVTTYANDPGRLSAGASLAQIQLGLKGVLYLDGGWQVLVDGLGRAAEDAGVVVRTRAAVAAVEHEGSVRGVRLADGTRMPATGVVLATSPAIAASLVGGRVLAAWAEAAIPVRAACLDLALSRLPRPSARFALGIDAPLYFSVHSSLARLAPAGGALVHVARYLGSEPPEDAAGVARELEAFVDVLQPGWRDVVAQRRFVPSFVVCHALPTAAQGGTAGLPGPVVPEVAGLVVAGDWVGPEGLLLDAALASARGAARALLDARDIPSPERAGHALSAGAGEDGGQRWSRRGSTGSSKPTGASSGASVID